MKQRLGILKRHHAFGAHTSSAYTRNVGPSSTTTGNPDNALGSAASGNPSLPGAPSAGAVNGGGG
jgi:hypothetical protein